MSPVCTGLRISISLAILCEIFIQIGYFSKSYAREPKWVLFSEHSAVIHAMPRCVCVYVCYLMLNNIVTLKSRLRATQAHWKWHHSIDRVRVLFVFKVVGNSAI